MPKELPEGYELRGAAVSETEAVLDYLEVVMNAPREYFACIYRNFPGDVPAHSRIVLTDGRIVAHVHAFPIDFWMNGVRVPGMMIGDVGTHPDHRRKGLGTLLLEDACRHAREAHGSTFALLRSGVAHFYGAAAWDVLPMTSWRIDVAGFDVSAEVARLDETAAEAMKHYHVRRFERAEELGRIASIHEEQNRGRSLTVIRSWEYWRRHFYWSSHHEAESLFLVAEMNGGVVAYSRANAGRLTEMGCLPEHAPAAFALLESTIRQLRKKDTGSFEVLVPEDHCLWALLADSENAEAKEHRGHWLRQIDWAAMLEHFEVVFKERARRAGLEPTHPVTLALGGQMVTLPLGSEAEAPAEACDLELSQIDAFRLVTGAVRGSSLTDDPELGKLLDCLFEEDSPIFWPMDVV